MSGSLSLLTIIILGFGILILATKKGKRRADYLLLLWFAIFLIHLVTINQLTRLPKWWFALNTAVTFLHGPLFYAYVISLQKDKKLATSATILLGAALLLGSILSLLAQPVPFIVNVIVVGVFAFLTSQILWQREPGIKDFSPAILKWLRFLLLGMTTLLLIPLVQLIINPTWLQQSNNLIGTVFYCVFILVLTFWGIRVAPVLVAEMTGTPPPFHEPEPSKPRYHQSTLSDEQRQSIFQKLETVMRDDLLYLDANLTLRTVAEKLAVSANQLSEAVNVSSDRNFNDYVNSFRIKAVCKKLETGDHNRLTFLAIALECGFNSKASFNRSFRKQIGQTPSAFAKSLAKE